MGTVVFWICFCILVVLIIVSGIRQSAVRKAGRTKIIKEIFESGADVVYEDTGFSPSAGFLGYMRNKQPDDFLLDETTVSDLAIRQLYMRMNRCMTNAGEDYLNCRLRMMQKDSEGIADTLKVIRTYSDDADRAVLIMNILDKCSKQNDTDTFCLIDALAQAKTTGLVQDVIPLIILIAAICLCPFYPLWGIAATVISIIVCIATYFAGKNVMDENLRGLSMALRYIVCGVKLSEAGVKEFDEYRDLGIWSKASFLIPYKDTSTSNPLSLLYDYVRMITHVDLIAYKIRISGIKNHHARINDLYAACGRLDACIAVASYLNHRENCDAVFCDDNKLCAKGIYHPFIINPVCNDMDTARSVVITGSNASGKSTFLKAVGISTLTAASFGFAFADEYETGRFDLYTSMALSDDLLGGDSYYVVEAKSLKRIVDAAKCGRVLCIVDEVLKGTNTVERIAASTWILKALSQKGVLCFAATHDLELPSLLADDMDSYYFTEEIDEGNVTFPYVINRGTTDKTNAIRLLSSLGFDSDIVDNANALANRFKESGKWEIG